MFAGCGVGGYLLMNRIIPAMGPPRGRRRAIESLYFDVVKDFGETGEFIYHAVTIALWLWMIAVGIHVYLVETEPE